MRTSSARLKITFVDMTYPGQRPETPSLSSHFLLIRGIESAECKINFCSKAALLALSGERKGRKKPGFSVLPFRSRDNACYAGFAAFCVSLVLEKATDRHVIRVQVQEVLMACNAF